MYDPFTPKTCLNREGKMTPLSGPTPNPRYHARGWKRRGKQGGRDGAVPQQVNAGRGGYRINLTQRRHELLPLLKAASGRPIELNDHKTLKHKNTIRARITLRIINFTSRY